MRVINWATKNRITILQISILVICVIVPTVLLIPAGKPKTIASLISLNLNGETKEDIQAQILIENITTHEMEENIELINLVLSDLNFLETQIEGLDNILIYNLSYSPLPGYINLYLENIRFREKSFLEKINDIIETDLLRWWYVKELVFTSILEQEKIVDDVDFTYCGNFASFSLLSYESPHRYLNNVTLQSNESLIASWWINETGYWTFNEEFLNVIATEILSLSEKIAGIEEISNPYNDFTIGNSIEPVINETWVNLRYPVLCNLSEPIPTEYALYFGDVGLTVDFSKNASRTERNAALKTLLKIISSKWFVGDIYEHGPCDFGGDMVRFMIGMAILFFACVAIIPVTTYRLVKKARRRKES